MFVRTKGCIIDYVSENVKPDIYGEITNFRALTSSLVKNIASQGKWFSFGTKVDDKQVNIFSIQNKDGVKLGNLIYDSIDCEEGYLITLYRYLLTDYLCYCEIPTVIRQRDYAGYKDSYNKCLITSNIYVIANWLGIPVQEAEAKYGSRIANTDDFDRDDGMQQYVKLTRDKQGTPKVSKPRKDLDLTQKGIRIIPLFALAKGVEVLYKMCSEDFYDVEFVKDSGQVRKMNICFDYSKLCSVYTDKGALSEQYGEQYSGDFLNVSSLNRGYIRVIEVGTNLKNRALRSINFARILGYSKAQPDLTFIDIDLDTVKNTFLYKASEGGINYKEFVDMLDVFEVGTTREYNGKRVSSYMELESWVESQEILLSTPFIKQLALFMIGNPLWYPGYPKNSDISSKDFDLSDLSEDDFDFELG